MRHLHAVENGCIFKSKQDSSQYRLDEWRRPELHGEAMLNTLRDNVFLIIQLDTRSRVQEACLSFC